MARLRGRFGKEGNGMELADIPDELKGRRPLVNKWHGPTKSNSTIKVRPIGSQSHGLTKEREKRNLAVLKMVLSKMAENGLRK